MFPPKDHKGGRWLFRVFVSPSRLAHTYNVEAALASFLQAARKEGGRKGETEGGKEGAEEHVRARGREDGTGRRKNAQR